MDTEAVAESLPRHYSILLVGPPGIGKFEWLLASARAYLRRNERVVFVTLDLHPREIRIRAEAMGLDLGRSEGTNFAFIDCYSSSAQSTSEDANNPKLWTVSSYSNLEALGMAISRASVSMGLPVRILFYSITTLFLHNSPQAIAKFLQMVTNRVKTELGSIAYAVQEGVHDPQTLNLLRSLVDGVLEMRFTESMDREFRTHHLRGMPATPKWETFQVLGVA
jgi:KaiC/GvpD/RAD55 family RecA-like ATPase